MNVQLAAAAVVLGVVSTATVGVSAAPMTIYDPVSHTYFTYDPEKLRRDAFGPRGPADAEQPIPANPTSATAGGAVRSATIITAARRDKPDPKFDRQVVDYDTTEAPGTVIIDTEAKFLYYVLDDGQALRMGVGVGREGFGWTGVVKVGDKQVAPKWFPPPDMVGRQPELAEYVAEGMPGGESNPLGERAIYLHDDNGKDTLYRIHGTIEPWSIGLNVSSGCIRMLNENVIDLYERVELGAKVIVM